MFGTLVRLAWAGFNLLVQLRPSWRKKKNPVVTLGGPPGTLGELCSLGMGPSFYGCEAGHWMPLTWAEASGVPDKKGVHLGG